MKKSILIVLSIIFFLLGKSALSNSNTQIIQEMLTAVCGEFQTSGTGTDFEIKGDASLQLSKIIERLTSTGLGGAGTFSSDEYVGVLRSEVGTQLNSVRDCRERVWKDLSELLTPSAVTSIFPRTIILRADSFSNGCDVASTAVNTELVDRYGEGVILNAPPYSERPNCAEYVFDATTAAPYRLSIEYAAESSRPITVMLNGEVVRDGALASVTGCWEERCQRWADVATVYLNGGPNRLLLESSSLFPHIRGIRLEPR